MATLPGEAIPEKINGGAPGAVLQLKQPKLEELLAHAPAAIAFLSGPELRCSFVNDMAVKVKMTQQAAAASTAPK